MIEAPSLAGLDGISHRFFTRRGGVSAGLYSSLNCGYGSGDSPDNVRENRRRVAEIFGHGEPELLTLHQIHSTEIITVGAERWTSPGGPKADGLVTDRPDVVLGAMAADCAPVLFADAAAGVIGAAHAGWKGALTGVAESTIAAMICPRAAPSFSISAMVDSSTPVNAPFQPEWAAPITRACGSTNRIGPQSAAVTPSASPGTLVTMASARGRVCVSHGAEAIATSGE
jgi:copper oxidase (laccase) domain-containing protein